MTIETKVTANELQKAYNAAKSKVELHFTAKGNPAWRVRYNYGRHNLEIGYDRLTKKEADERLAEFGLTANLVIEIAKALDKAQADKTAAMRASGEIFTAGRNAHKLTQDEITAVFATFATADNAQFTFDVQRFATTDIVTATIENLPDDMKDAVREQYAPYKAEFNAAIEGIYLDDYSLGRLGNPPIIPAADLLKKVIPLAITDHSSTAYRKNFDGTFTEDKAAFKRLEQVEIEMFNAAGHKIGCDNPEFKFDVQRFSDTEDEETRIKFRLAVGDSEVDGWSHLEIGGEQLTFNRGKLVAISSPRYDAEMRFNGKTKIYRYRSCRLKTKKEFFARIENECRSVEQSELVIEFMTAHEMTDTLHNHEEQIGKFLVQIEPTLPNGRMFYYAKAVDDFSTGKAIIDEFKKCAVMFTARIKENHIGGEQFYGRNLLGGESIKMTA